ncbi:MAG: hypothetical protein EOP49_10015, partial [Sphingobacteriales bacterium]
NVPLVKLESTNLGPGAIAQPSVVKGPGFALPATEWIAVQTYVLNALALPTTIEAFKTSLGKGAPADLSDFNNLVAAYSTIHEHVSKWQNDTFPKSVSLASDVYNYAQEVPTYYTPIIDLAAALAADPDDAQAKTDLLDILALLQGKADNYSKNALKVQEDIRDFANKTLQDKITLTGADGKSGLKKYYADKHGATSAEVIAITKELEAQKLVLNAANDDYNYDVVVASTTPTYAWVFPFGTIAAAIVAGIYGDKAVKALERVRAAQQQINNMSAKLAADALLMIAINNTESGIGTIAASLNAALPIIQKIQGVWQAISDDMKHIAALVKTNISEVNPAIMKFGVKAAIKSWSDVGLAADEYRKNAYVTI